VTTGRELFATTGGELFVTTGRELFVATGRELFATADRELVGLTRTRVSSWMSLSATTETCFRPPVVWG
jgi:hypothetical protein